MFWRRHLHEGCGFARRLWLCTRGRAQGFTLALANGSDTGSLSLLGCTMDSSRRSGAPRTRRAQVRSIAKPYQTRIANRRRIRCTTNVTMTRNIRLFTLSHNRSDWITIVFVVLVVLVRRPSWPSTTESISSRLQRKGSFLPLHKPAHHCDTGTK